MPEVKKEEATVEAASGAYVTAAPGISVSASDYRVVLLLENTGYCFIFVQGSISARLYALPGSG